MRCRSINPGLSLPVQDVLEEARAEDQILYFKLQPGFRSLVTVAEQDSLHTLQTGDHGGASVRRQDRVWRVEQDDGKRAQFRCQGLQTLDVQRQQRIEISRDYGLQRGRIPRR